MKSYAAWMMFKNEPPATNALRFATEQEADAYGRELFSRWMMPTGYEVRESDDPVNYRFDFSERRAISTNPIAV